MVVSLASFSLFELISLKGVNERFCELAHLSEVFACQIKTIEYVRFTQRHFLQLALLYLLSPDFIPDIILVSVFQHSRPGNCGCLPLAAWERNLRGQDSAERWSYSKDTSQVICLSQMALFALKTTHSVGFWLLPPASMGQNQSLQSLGHQVAVLKAAIGQFQDTGLLLLNVDCLQERLWRVTGT